MKSELLKTNGANLKQVVTKIWQPSKTISCDSTGKGLSFYPLTFPTRFYLWIHTCINGKRENFIWVSLKGSSCLLTSCSFSGILSPKFSLGFTMLRSMNFISLNLPFKPEYGILLTPSSPQDGLRLKWVIHSTTGEPSRDNTGTAPTCQRQRPGCKQLRIHPGLKSHWVFTVEQHAPLHS